jgi:hypothetical protein
VTGDLVERLRSALDRAEEIARGADHGPWEVGPSFGARNNRVYVRQEGDLIDSIGTCVIAGQVSNMPQFRQNAIFIATNHPAHVLRTIRAHRKIVDRHGKGHWCISADGGYGRMWWPSVAGSCEDVRDVAAIYLPDIETGDTE